MKNKKVVIIISVVVLIIIAVIVGVHKFYSSYMFNEDGTISNSYELYYEQLENLSGDERIELINFGVEHNIITQKDSPENKTTVLNELNLETGELIEIDRFDGSYSDLENIEGISFNDMLYLQNDVDNGHYSWRLKPEDVVREYWHNLYGISNGVISNIEYTDLNEAIVEYTLNDQTYELSLVQPIKKGDTGIWNVRECRLNLIPEDKEKLTLEKVKKLAKVTYTRESINSDWIFEEVQKLTTNQIID